MKLEDVEVSYEGKRGCGYRKGGGLYLVSSGTMEPCGKLPIRCEVCPTCGEGIRVARGFTWVDGDKLCDPEPHGDPSHQLGCPLASPIGRAGLIWIGEKFYPTTLEFQREARELGVSRRITAVPRDFVVGETLVLLGHRKAIRDACPDCGDRAESEGCETCDEERVVFAPGIFTAFRPRAVEYVCKGEETEEELDALLERGIKPVRVEERQTELEGAGA